MKLSNFIFIAFTLFSSISGWAAGLKGYSLTHQAMKRDYSIYTPKKLQPFSSVVIVLHGGFGNYQSAIEQTGMNSLADKYGFVAVYPNGIANKSIYGDNGQHWNDGRVAGIPVDDVGFISRMIDEVARKHSIDRKRVYATGISNGAMMTFRLALELSHKIAAVAPVAGLLPQQLLRITREKAVPVALFIGTADPIMPFSGGPVKSQIAGDVLSADKSMKIFVDANRCRASKATELKNINRLDRSTVKQITYSLCLKNNTLEYYQIIGGGHTWPGMGRGNFLVGSVNLDINASEEIIKFFNKHRLP